MNRFLEQYDALFFYFDTEAKDKKNKSAEEAQKILNILMNLYTKLYLHFLNHVLPLITTRNREFLFKTTNIYDLYSKMASFFKTIIYVFIFRQDDDYMMSL